MRFGSLFSGIGGFDLGLERAGMQCAWQVEIDPACQKLLKEKFPDAKLFTDVRQVGSQNLDAVDLVCGGFPCQDVSVAGKRRGLSGERSGLWFEFHRIVKEIIPQWVIVENVPGLFSSEQGRDFAVILRGLDELGYGVSWRVFDSRYFGVPQRRRRVFIVASLGSADGFKVLFESESVSRDIAPRGETRETVAAYAVRRAQTGSNGWGIRENETGTIDNTGGDAVFNVSGTLAANGGGLDRPAGNANEADFCITTVSGIGEYVEDNVSTSLRLGSEGNNGSGVLVAKTMTGRNERNNASDENYIVFSGDGSGSDATKNISPTLWHGGDAKEHHRAFRKMAVAYGIVGETTPKVSENVMPTLRSVSKGSGEQHQFVAWHKNKAGELTPDDVAKSLRSGASHSYQGVGVRRLTPVECERLQGFPDGWTRGFADSTRYRMLGNAVTVNVAHWIGKRIIEIETAVEPSSNERSACRVVARAQRDARAQTGRVGAPCAKKINRNGEKGNENEQ